MNPTPPASPAAPRSRALETALLLLAVLGLGIAIYLVVVHLRPGAGDICRVAAGFDCAKVAASRWSTVLGVPLAAWGVFAYVLVGALAVSARRGARGPGFGAGLLVLLGAFMTGAAVVLAYVSEVLIGSLCLFCMGSWIVSAAILVVALALARRAGGAGAAIGADLEAIGRHRGASAAAAAGLLVVAGGLVALYRIPRAVPKVQGPVVVLEFSDYQCPFCAMMHQQEKGILAANPDLRLERRHFPLDSACNPLVKGHFHDGSCLLARAALCADEQGRFHQMDDALFANQQAKLPLDAVAEQAGLDLARLHACLDSPTTTQRLEADIQQGMSLGLRGTPSYVHQGKIAKGLVELLDELSRGQGARATR